MSLVENAKDIYELIKKSTTIEVQEKLMQLREEALKLQEENLALRQRIQQLEGQLSQEQNLEFDGRVYWQKQGENKSGPFCPTCHDTKKLMVRLQKSGSGWWCTACENGFWPSRPAAIISWPRHCA
jgi:hypothetical protein